jgi:20S proteasome alpha/beta subunit
VTLVLAIKAADGVVIASDSQSTSGADSVRTRGEAQKLDDLFGQIAFGCSGTAGLRQRVVGALRKELSATDCKAPLEELRPLIRGIVNPVQQEALSEHVSIGDAAPACLEMLFVGVTAGRSWIYEIAADGKDEEHPAAEAIGGARHYAIHGMVYNHHLALDQRPLNQVRVAAYRILMNTILADGTGAIGIPVQVYEAREGGVTALTPSQLKAMHDTLNALKEQEHDLWGSPATDLTELEPVGGVQVDDSRAARSADAS